MRTGSPSLLALHAHRLFERYQIDLVLDVGGRVGDYGAWLRHNGYSGDIVSFEPVKQSFAQLETRRGMDSRWQVLNMALGSTSEERDINVTNQTHFSSFLKPNDYSRRGFGVSSAVQSIETVQIRRLDEVWDSIALPEPHPRIYLKMDTQGWDLEVLRGATGCLDDVVALQSEVSVQPIYDGMPPLTESLAEFERLGFVLSGLFPVNLDREMRVIEFDCVAVRPGRIM